MKYYSINFHALCQGEPLTDILPHKFKKQHLLCHVPMLGHQCLRQNIYQCEMYRSPKGIVGGT